MNILITGGNSHLVKSLIKLLSTKNYNIFLISRKNKINIPNIRLITLDLSRGFSDKKVLTLINNKKLPKNFHTIFHFAFSVINKNQPDNESLLSKNIAITNNIIEFSNFFQINQFVNISSSSVYLKANIHFKLKKKLTIDDYYYSLSNIYAEHLINIELRKTIKFISHLRVSNVFTHSNNGRGVLNHLYNELKKFNTITLYDKSRKVSFTSIDYLINFLLLSLSKNKNGNFDINENNFSLIKFANFLKKSYGNMNTIIKVK
jgi:nucleoside-diphosphate-sugar epimerase